MTTFDKREEAFEKKFALDEAQKFKAEARRNRLLGIWAAEKLGLSGEAASAYARETVAGAFAQGGDKAVIVRLASDLAPKEIAEDAIRAQMSELMVQAITQVKAGL
ncbi:MAG TPA: DUF1476 domain-containing protein [Bradyrhizobium sp.]|nr:DUF1476 domain-containing protein [Bradyrhizobium sp.]